MPFSKRSFELLSALEKEGRYAYVQENKAEFESYIITPFQELVEAEVWSRLPEHLLATLNADNRVFGLLNKNDFGKGGAHAFYWGAFSPRRAVNKQHDAQLLTFLAPTYLEFGFFFGWETPRDVLQKFQQNVTQLVDNEEAFTELVAHLEEYLPSGSFVIREMSYPPETYIAGPLNSLVHQAHEYYWDGMLEMIPDLTAEELPGFSPMKVLAPDTVSEMTYAELAVEIVFAFIAVFPFMVLATATSPVQEVREFIQRTRDWAVEAQQTESSTGQD